MDITFGELQDMLLAYKLRHNLKAQIILSGITINMEGMFRGKAEEYDYFDNAYLFQFNTLDELIAELNR